MKRRQFLAGVAASFPLLGGCAATDATPEQTDTGPTGEPPDALQIVTVNVARQHDRVGVSGIIENDNGRWLGACIRVALYDSEGTEVFSGHIYEGESAGSFGHYVRWWDADRETIESIETASARLVGRECSDE